MKKILSYLVLLAAISFSVGCKKNLVEPKPEEEGEGKEQRKEYLGSEYENKLRDSIWYYYKVFSLWEQYVPPRTSLIGKIDEENYLRDNYTKYFETGEDVLDHLMGLTKQAGQKGKDNYDWYSFMDRNGTVSGAIGEGRVTDYGFYVSYIERENSNGNADLYVRMTEVNSPAYEAGLHRGDRIKSINGDSKIDYNSQEAIGFRTINSYLNSHGELSLEIEKPNGSTEIRSVKSSAYTMNPIISRNVLDLNGRKIGYMAYSSFMDLDASFKDQGSLKTMKQAFDDLFTDFESKGVTELVVDLRYNGGGSVVTAEYLADRIAPVAANKQLMYTFTMNALLTREGWTDKGDEFGPVYFSKKGALNLSRVYFLVSSATASASELLINSLKPYMPVYLIGTYTVDDSGKQVVAENTYGKPAGFFEYPIIGGDVSIYVTSFKMYNNNKEGDYFTGLKPTSHVWEFSNFFDFGHQSESMLSAALHHIETGSFTGPNKLAAAKGATRVNRTKTSLKLKEKNRVNGMFKFNKETLRLKE